MFYRTPTEHQNPRSFGILGGCGLAQEPLHGPEKVHVLHHEEIMVAADLDDATQNNDEVL